MTLPINTLLQGGKYKILRFINSGGFGCTYEALHVYMNSKVAIKEFFVKDFCNRDEQTNKISVGTQSKIELVSKLRKKFVGEAQAVFQMNHPNIIRVTDVFEENGTAYYVMEYIEGESLHDMVKRCGKLSESTALGYTWQVADALVYVHGQNRLHLDIKPGNIMVNKDGHAKLIDFGASKHYSDETGENTSTLMGVNTQGYAPIEQVNTSFTNFSPATDIYALGATLYKLLTGITPPSSVGLISKEEQLQPLPHYISQSTRLTVEKAMQPSRHERYQTVEAFVKALNIVPVADLDEELTKVEADGDEEKTVGNNINKVIMEIARERNFACYGRAYMVYIDNRPIQKLSSGKSFKTEVPRQPFVLKIDLAKTYLFEEGLMTKEVTIYPEKSPNGIIHCNVKTKTNKRIWNIGVNDMKIYIDVEYL